MMAMGGTLLSVATIRTGTSVATMIDYRPDTVGQPPYAEVPRAPMQALERDTLHAFGLQEQF